MNDQIELQGDEEFASLDGDQVENYQPPQETTVEDDLPDKYRGKSPKEIAKMHQEAEKLIGRHGQEVRELRELADSLIKQQLKPQVVEQSPEIDFFEDPKTAVRKTVESSPEFQELRALNQQMKLQELDKKLTQKHGDYKTVAQDPSFIEWIKSNKNRVDSYLRAENNLDFDAADDLLTSYKAQKGFNAPAADNQQEVRDKQFKSAGIENSGSGAGAAKKIYRRADLIRLMKEDPRRYEKMQPEIMQAYHDKRVR